jgi:hypothetical protein
MSTTAIALIEVMQVHSVNGEAFAISAAVALTPTFGGTP